MKFQELDYEDLVITTDEINHEDFPNNLTEEQRITGKFYLPICKDFGIAKAEYNHEDFWKNFTEGKSGVQFIHRYLAYVVVAFIGVIWFRGRRIASTQLQRKALNSLLLLVGLQFLLGVFTLLYQVPVVLGVLHQVVAFFLLASMTFTLHRFSK